MEKLSISMCKAWKSFLVKPLGRMFWKRHLSLHGLEKPSSSPGSMWFGKATVGSSENAIILGYYCCGFKESFAKLESCMEEEALTSKA